jgi:hypothetical protein
MKLNKSIKNYIKLKIWNQSKLYIGKPSAKYIFVDESGGLISVRLQGNQLLWPID